MKKITLLLLAMIMSFGVTAQDELLFDGSATAPGQKFFRQGPSYNSPGSTQEISDDGSGSNNVLEVTRTTNAGAAWHVLPLLDAGGAGVARSIGDGGTFAALRLRVRTTKNGDASLSARLQNTTSFRAPDVMVTGGDGTNFGAWQTIVLNFSTAPAENKRPEFIVDSFESTTSPPAAAFQIQFDDIEVITAATLSTSNFSKSKLEAFYNASRDAIMMKNSDAGNFAIYNLMGQSVLKGKISNTISVETLKSGLYILSTKKGSLKFVK